MSSLTAGKPAPGTGPTTRSRRLRRGLIALGLVVALPGAVATSSASAYHASLKPCEYKGAYFNDGTNRTTSGVKYKCSDGEWFRTSPAVVVVADSTRGHG